MPMVNKLLINNKLRVKFGNIRMIMDDVLKDSLSAKKWKSRLNVGFFCFSKLKRERDSNPRYGDQLGQ